MRAALAALHPPEPRHPFPPRDPSRPKGHNVLGTLALHPALATAYHTFNGHILFATTLTVRQRELLVLRVAHRRDATYEWAQHAVLAADADITADEVERIRRPSVTEADGWSPLDAAVLRAADELIDDARIADDTWAALATDLDPQQMLDLIFTVGAYDVLAMALRSFDVPLDDDLRKRPSR
jgi:alkylhydroperoxidase family enzyme